MTKHRAIVRVSKITSNKKREDLRVLPRNAWSALRRIPRQFICFKTIISAAYRIVYAMFGKLVAILPVRAVFVLFASLNDRVLQREAK